MKKIILPLLLVLTVFAITACQNLKTLPTNVDTYDLIQERDYIIVGMECNYAPFNWSVEKKLASESALKLVGSNTYCDGYDVEIAQTIADELGLTLYLRAIEWDGLIPSLAINGSIDMIIAGMSPTSERAQSVAFSEAYYHSTHVVVLRLDSVFAGADSIEDFVGANITAQLNTFYDELVNQLTGAIHANPLGDVPTIITGIKTGLYDATILELPVAIAVTQSNPDLMYIDFSGSNGFSVTYEDSAVSIALRQSDKTLLKEVNRILASFSAETKEQWMVSAINRQPE